MGYYTAFDLAVKGINSNEEYDALTERLDEIGLIGYVFSVDGFDPKCKIQTYSCNDTAKWYDSTEDMERISEEFPNMTFRLSGNGENYEDYWIAYFYRGNSEVCNAEIRIPEPETIKW